MTVTESVPDGCRTASSATQELDDLMASLSDFKVGTAPDKASVARTVSWSGGREGVAAAGYDVFSAGCMLGSKYSTRRPPCHRR